MCAIQNTHFTRLDSSVRILTTPLAFTQRQIVELRVHDTRTFTLEERVNALIALRLPFMPNVIEMLLDVVDRNISKLYYPHILKYPLKFSLNLTGVFLEVHHPKAVLLVGNDPSNSQLSISKGEFKRVARAWNLIYPEIYAYATTPPEDIRWALREEEGLIKLSDCKNVISLEAGLYYMDQTQVLIMKYYPMTLYSLQKNKFCHLITDEPYSDKWKIECAIQILEGVTQINQHEMIHRDLKNTNILVDGQGNVKIIDFGISCSSTNTEELNKCLTTRFLKTPEMIEKNVSHETQDDWAAGCMLFNIFTNKDLPWYDDLIKRKWLCALTKMREFEFRVFTFEHPTVEKVFRAIKGLLKVDPTSRMRAEQATTLLREAFLGEFFEGSPIFPISITFEDYEDEY